MLFGRSASTGSGDLSGGNVASIATVNGVVIPKATYDTQLQGAIANYKAQGINVEDPNTLNEIKKQILSNLVNNELLSQTVAAAGIKSNPEEVEKQYQVLLVQTGGADKLKEELAKNNLTDALLRENIAKQLAIQAYLAQNVDMSSVAVNDKEVENFYAEFSKSQKDKGQAVPALKEVSEQIKQQLVSNKQQALVSAFLEELQKKSKIEITSSL